MNSTGWRSGAFVVARGQIPAQLEAGILYVNPQGSRSHHLCACGCGQRVILPLNAIEWELTGAADRPSLHPSVGNWNLDCKSHYVLSRGRVQWRRRFSQSEIEAVRRKDLRPYQQSSWTRKFRDWIKRLAHLIRRD